MNSIAMIAGKTFGIFLSLDCLKYLVFLYLLQFIALPLSHRFLHRTKIAWFSASKLLGLSLLNFIAWFIGHNAFGWSPGNVPGSGSMLHKVIICLVGNGLGIAPYSRATLFVLLILGALLAWWGYKKWGEEIRRRFRRNMRTILLGEALFLAAFAFAAVLRMSGPNIAGQEKFMDLAFLNSLASNTQLPPADPWRYSLPINYYYGGYMQMATLAKVTGVQPAIAFNLSVAVIFAFTCLLAFALAFELTRRARWALLAICAVVLMGNLDVVAQNFNYLKDLSPTKHFGIDWWRPSRVIHDGAGEATINEFPYFSFFLADLHPHMMGIPFVLFFLCAIHNLFKTRHGHFACDTRGSQRWKWLRLLLIAWSLGSLAFINGFDFIAFGGGLGIFMLAREWRALHGCKSAARLNLLTCLTLLMSIVTGMLFKTAALVQHAYAPDSPPDRIFWSYAWLLPAMATLAIGGITLRRWLNAGRPRFLVLNTLLIWGGIGVASVILFAPFFINYHAPISGKIFAKPEAGISLSAALVSHFANDLPIGFVDFRSGMFEFLTMWGTHAAIILVFLLASTRAIFRKMPDGWRMFIGPVSLVIWGLFMGLWGHVIAATLPFIAAWTIVAFRVTRKTPNRAFVLAVIFLSLLILFGCEQIYIRDSYGQNLQRMNTLFKFYYPVWILLGVSIPFCLREALRNPTLSRTMRYLIILPGFALLLWAMEYPVCVTWAREDSYAQRCEAGVIDPGLNGATYLDQEHPTDYQAIEWLRTEGRAYLDKQNKNKTQTAGERPSEKNPVPIVLEGIGGSYTYYARVSTYTGMRAVLGWPGHEQVWRGPYPSEIESDVRKIFSASSLSEPLQLLRKYNVDFIFIGELERKDFPASSLAKFKTLPVAYQTAAGESIIYAVPAK